MTDALIKELPPLAEMIADMLATQISNIGYPVGMGIPPAREHLEQIAGWVEKLCVKHAALSAPGDAEPVGWVQVHPNGHKAFYDGNPLLVHDNGMPTFPVYRRPVEPVVTRWHMMVGDWRDETVALHGPNGLITSGLTNQQAVDIIAAHGGVSTDEAALNVSQPGVK